MEYDIPSVAKLHSMAEHVPTLSDDVRKISNRLAPSNGASFSAGNTIQFDLPNQSSMVPESLVLCYTLNLTTAGADAVAATPAAVAGTPCYAPFNRLDTQCNGGMIHSITNYNSVGHLLSKTRMSLGARAGSAVSLGIWQGAVTTTAGVTGAMLENLNGYGLPIARATYPIPLAQPVICPLSTSDKLVPLFLGSSFRLSFTLDSASNFTMAGVGAAAAACTVNAAYTITDVSLQWDSIDFGASYQDMLRNAGPQFMRCTIYSGITQSVGAGAGPSNINMTFQQRYRSIRSVYMLPTVPGRPYCDVVDLGRQLGGNLRLSVGSTQFPATGIDMRNRTEVFNCLRQACHSSAHSGDAFDMAIPQVEWVTYGTCAADGAVIAGSTFRTPGSYFVGVNLEKVNGSNFMVNGTSSQESPIQITYVTNGETPACNVLSIVAADCILRVDPSTRQFTADL